MKKYTMQLVAYSKAVDITAENEDEAHTKLNAHHSLQELGIEDTDSKILDVKEVESCKHTRVRFTTEVIKEIPEGYDKMQEKMETDKDLNREDYVTDGWFINKEICADCGKVLETDEA